MTEKPKVYKSIQEALLDYAKESRKNYNESMSAPVTIPDWKEPTAEELQEVFEEIVKELKENSQELDVECKKVLYDKLWDLYEKVRREDD